MLMLKRTHAREMAAKDAETGVVRERLANARRFLDQNHRDLERKTSTIYRLEDENADLRARLAKFTGPRERGQGGRFVSRGAK